MKKKPKQLTLLGILIRATFWFMLFVLVVFKAIEVKETKIENIQLRKEMQSLKQENSDCIKLITEHKEEAYDEGWHRHVRKGEE